MNRRRLFSALSPSIVILALIIGLVLAGLLVAALEQLNTAVIAEDLRQSEIRR